MIIGMQLLRPALAVILTIVLFASAPVALAQESNIELRAAIRSALLSDPRSAEMEPAAFEALVSALAVEAEEKGVTVRDIEWRPSVLSTFEEGTSLAPQECRTYAFICALNWALGFDGSDLAIPITLGSVAAVLLFVIGMLLHHRGHHPLVPAIAPAPQVPAPQSPPAPGM